MERNLIKELNLSSDYQSVLFIGGPTASGKTGLAIKIAHQFQNMNQPTSIISADSRQIYVGMTVCTAKPIERPKSQISSKTYELPVNYKNVDHYLFDIKEPNQRYTLFDFKDQAEQLIKYLHNKKQKVIVAGGTGLYIDALINNYSHSKKTEDQVIKQNLLEEYNSLKQTKSKEEANLKFWKDLESLLPSQAQNIAENNWQGVLRALEVYYVSQEEKTSVSSKSEPSFKYQMVILNPPRHELYNHINRRCEEMVSEGLVEETKRLHSTYSKELPAMTSIGYREFTQYLDGSLSQQEALSQFQKATRNYAKRQLTWFRRYKDNPHCVFVDSYSLLK